MKASELLSNPSAGMIYFASKKAIDDKSFGEEIAGHIFSENTEISRNALSIALHSSIIGKDFIGKNFYRILENYNEYNDDDFRSLTLSLFNKAGVPEKKEMLEKLMILCFSEMRRKTKHTILKINAMDVLLKISEQLHEIRGELFWQINEQIFLNQPEFREKAEIVLDKLLSMEHEQK
ncbi:MAG: hypothetical protein A2W91_16630 [Bacteroidetes bacterium GWF2_38_335]|nr:MAG: hypothetical protein A2W91_16630 [Bacteroidetes bacterium GWF2_38_335]OFY81313.1 MAG: hypothetical protein A2281_07605 [Bacteroidetes bacterium RIFOXYA12_FULL_38_20]HBS85434.1 hypothetical protein [Bacteroidales bacterium]